MKIIGIQGCKKVKSLLGFAETVRQSSNFFNEAVDALTSRFANVRRHDIKGQAGRSMIEMLGVLAIIGILSIGGLAGYSKAIDRYRINETINQITHIVQNTRDLFRTQKNFYGSLSSSGKAMSTADHENRTLASKAKIFPTSLVKNDYKNLFGGEVFYYSKGRFAENDGKSFNLGFNGIPQEACIELATRDWQSGLGLVAMRVYGKNNHSGMLGSTFSTNCTSQYETDNALVCAKDMPMSIEYAIAACNNEKDNSIYWKFY